MVEKKRISDLVDYYYFTNDEISFLFNKYAYSMFGIQKEANENRITLWRPDARTIDSNLSLNNYSLEQADYFEKTYTIFENPKNSFYTHSGYINNIKNLIPNLEIIEQKTLISKI